MERSCGFHEFLLSGTRSSTFRLAAASRSTCFRKKSFSSIKVPPGRQLHTFYQAVLSSTGTLYPESVARVCCVVFATADEWRLLCGLQNHTPSPHRSFRAKRTAVTQLSLDALLERVIRMPPKRARGHVRDQRLARYGFGQAKTKLFQRALK